MWITLDSENGLQEIIRRSYEKPQVIFKHSTRCSISSVAKSRLEGSSAPENADFHYLDVIANRSLSNAIAETFSVQHESPQILIIKNGECIYDDSHTGINMRDIDGQVS